ncbi:hypothetical protein SAMN05444414_14413, partial [Roseovarius marisflavi]
SKPRKQAGHMTASDKCTNLIKNVLLCRSHPHRHSPRDGSPVDPETGLGLRNDPMCLDEGLSGRPIFWSRAVTALRGGFFASGGVHVPGGQAPLVGASAGPTAGIVQCDEALFLQFRKRASGSAFRYAQRGNGCVHRQAHSAIVTVIVAAMKSRPDFDCGPICGSEGQNLRRKSIAWRSRFSANASAASRGNVP